MSLKKQPFFFIFFSVSFFAFYLFISCRLYHGQLNLVQPAALSGWSLTAFILFLAGFNLRKKLSMIPLGKASTWLILHVVGGLLTLGFFWLHTRRLWPQGFYEQWLAGLFYFISLNGLFGYFLQRIYPSRLTQTGIEIIYERIPAEIAEIRSRVEALVQECTRETASDTLAQYYFETFLWFFRKPRFFSSHALGGKKASHWVRYHLSAVKRYLNQPECVYLEKIKECATLKNKIDFHYAAQSLIKKWLLVHVPLAALLVVLMGWHILLVHIYLL